MKRILSLIIVSLILIITTTGCMDREQLKDDFTAALAKHIDMQSYSFSGTAQFAIQHSDVTTSTNTLNSNLIKLLMNSTIAWEGIAAMSPLQLEATIHLTAAGESVPYEIPLILKDNMMYIHIPMLNSENQYMEIDFAKLTELSGRSNDTMEQLGLAGQLFTGIAKAVVHSIDPKYFNESKLEQSTGERELIATIKTSETDAAIKLWFDAVPLIMSQLAEAGYINDVNAAASWANSASDDPQQRIEEYSDQVVLRKPIVASTIIDELGFMRQLKLSMDSTRLATDSEAPQQWLIELSSNYDEINMNPVFTRDIPEDVLSFTDLLKVMTVQP